MDYVRKDFDEISQTIQEEVSSTATSVSTALKEKLKVRYISQFIMNC